MHFQAISHFNSLSIFFGFYLVYEPLLVKLYFYGIFEFCESMNLKICFKGVFLALPCFDNNYFSDGYSFGG